jgi:hypothetical protein
VQHLAQVAASLQQLPSQAEAADLEEPSLLQHLQPVLSSSPTAQIAPSISIFIFGPLISVVGLFRQRLPRRSLANLIFGWQELSMVQPTFNSSAFFSPRERHKK